MVVHWLLNHVVKQRTKTVGRTSATSGKVVLEPRCTKCTFCESVSVWGDYLENMPHPVHSY